MRRFKTLGVLAVGVLIGVLATVVVWPAPQARGQLKEPFLQYKIAFANGFVAGARYVAIQARAGALDLNSGQLAFLESPAFKAATLAQAEAYGNQLDQMNKAKQPGGGETPQQ